MGKKISFYLFLFIFLALANILICITIYTKVKKLQATKKILNEINPGLDPNKQFALSAAPFVLGVYQADATLADSRTANLKSFFRKYNSPLYDYAQKIIDVSDKYQFDYRLLPAIAMQESNLCKYIPDDSHNCWGWGIYGNQVTKFDSFEEAIETVATGIKKEYIDKGLLTASGIMEKYTPSSKGSWAYGVNTFLKILE